MNEVLRSGVRLLRPGPRERGAPTPPPDLPLARIVWIPGRGEIFLRELEGPQDALPVLLLHGWTASADTTWFAAYKSLAGRHRLLAIDQRGHGRGIRAADPFSLEACADDAAALLELLDVGPAIVAGYSMGGAVALLMWQRHHELVAGLVMAATALEWRSTWRQRLLWRSLGIFELALRLGTGDGFVQRYLNYAVAKTPEVEGLRAWVGGELKRGYPRDVADAARVLSLFDARPFARSIDVPCASVITERDRLVPSDEQRELARALAAPVVAVDGDHDAPLMNPTEFASAMLDAIGSVAGRGVAPAGLWPRGRTSRPGAGRN